MVLDAGKYGLYGYRPHVTGYEEIRDDFLSYIEELKQVGPIADTTNSAKEKHWRYELLGNSLGSVELQFTLVRWLTPPGSSKVRVRTRLYLGSYFYPRGIFLKSHDLKAYRTFECRLNNVSLIQFVLE